MEEHSPFKNGGGKRSWHTLKVGVLGSLPKVAWKRAVEDLWVPLPQIWGGKGRGQQRKGGLLIAVKMQFTHPRGNGIWIASSE